MRSIRWIGSPSASAESRSCNNDADWVASLPGNSVTARLEEARKHLRQYDFKPKRPLLSREPGSDEARKYADLMDQWERDLEAWNKAVESLKKHNSMLGQSRHAPHDGLRPRPRAQEPGPPIHGRSSRSMTQGPRAVTA